MTQDQGDQTNGASPSGQSGQSDPSRASQGSQSGGGCVVSGTSTERQVSGSIAAGPSDTSGVGEGGSACSAGVDGSRGVSSGDDDASTNAISTTQKSDDDDDDGNLAGSAGAGESGRGGSEDLGESGAERGGSSSDFDDASGGVR